MNKESLNISPSFEAVLDAAQVPEERALVDRRVARMVALAVLLGVAGGVVAMILQWLIALITHLAFYREWSLEAVSPAPAVRTLGWWVVAVPVAGALVVGVMARYGSKAIRGHGIPEAMEQVLTNRSRIPIRLTFLKPLSSAVAIGTGGPFGAEGPIIATGGALGSMLGQFIPATAAERRTLLAAGAAAGMAATFGTPVSAVLLAVELLLFEYRARSIIPVAFAAATATGVRFAFGETTPVFAMPDIHAASAGGLAFYAVMGGVMGLVAASVTRGVYLIEDWFERLPIHWMWWPAVGAVVVGVVGYFAPDTLGVGYYNITTILSVGLSAGAIAFLCGMKLISWSIALGSGTSGGTLAPLFTIGGGAGVLLGMAGHALMPRAAIDLRVAALVGMATIFAGASRAFLASTVFAFEATLQPAGLLPLLGGCAAAYLVSGLVMRNTIMTEKIARRGVRTPTEYGHDPLDHIMVGDIASRPAVTLRADESAGQVAARLASPGGNSHQGFPVVDDNGVLAGVIVRRDLDGADAGAALKDLMVQPPRFIYDDCTARQAAEHMVNHAIGRLPVLERDGSPPRVVGVVTRSDILACYRHRMDEERPEDPSFRLTLRARGRAGGRGA